MSCIEDARLGGGELSSRLSPVQGWRLTRAAASERPVAGRRHVLGTAAKGGHGVESAEADAITVQRGGEAGRAESSTNAGFAVVRPVAARRCCERGKKILETRESKWDNQCARSLDSLHRVSRHLTARPLACLVCSDVRPYLQDVAPTWVSRNVRGDRMRRQQFRFPFPELDFTGSVRVEEMPLSSRPQ